MVTPFVEIYYVCDKMKHEDIKYQSREPEYRESPRCEKSQLQTTDRILRKQSALCFEGNALHLYNAICYFKLQYILVCVLCREWGTISTDCNITYFILFDCITQK